MSKIRDYTDILREAIKSPWSRKIRTIQDHRVILSLELIVSLVIIGFASLYLARFACIKSTTSLGNDELYTIMNFSSQGVVKTLTDYHVPNNHIFFNLLNALTPGMKPYHPLRARLWSFIALGACIAAGVLYFFRQKRFVEGALFFQIVAVNYNLVDLTLRARGYAILCFCALATSVLLLRYLKTFQTRWLVLISLLTIAGTWTLPIYLGFSGMLLLLLFLWVGKPQVFGTGIVTMGIVIGTYVPVATQLIRHVRTYAEEWGREFNNLWAIARTVRFYLLNSFVFAVKFEDWMAFVFFFALLVVPYLIWGPHLIWKKQSVTGQGVCLLSLAALLLFTICRRMETPPMRTVSFVVLPLALCMLLIFSHILRNTYLASTRPILYVGIGVFFSLNSVQQIQDFQFMPLENWTETARHIERTFPEGMEVYATAPAYLRVYLNPIFPIGREFEVEKFLAGELVFVVNDWTNPEPLQPMDFSSASAEVFIPQIRGSHQNIAVTPPSEPWIEGVAIGDIELSSEAYDRDMSSRWSTSTWQSMLETPVTLRIFLKPGVRYRSFYLVSRDGNQPRNFQVYLGIGNKMEQLDDHFIVTTAKDVVVIALGDRQVGYIDLVVAPADVEYPFSVNEMWAYPARMTVR